MPYLGGFNITAIEWAGRNAVAVTVLPSSAYTDKLFQLYAGRQLVGCTSRPAETVVIGQVPAGQSACPLGIVVVEQIERFTDFGSILDLRPFNDYRLSWAAPVSPPADLHHFDIVAGTAPGEVYDVANVVARVPYQADRPSYSYVLPTFPTRGDWSLAVIARDDAQPLGNADGTPAELVVPTIIYPLDFEPSVSNGGLRRFSHSVTAGVLSINYTEQTPVAFP